MTVDLEQARAVAVRAAEAAGDLLRAGVLNGVVSRPKGVTGDVVTDLDVAAERLIIDTIQGSYPRHEIIAEESGVNGVNDTYTWLVDPLDGTNNVAIGLEAYVVGLALCVHRQPMLGVVHDPVRRQTLTAVRSGGARLDGEKLHRKQRPVDRPLVLGWIQGHGVTKQDPRAGALKLTLESGAHRVLQLWAPLLCWAMLARGDIDGIVGYQAEAVDLPAGALIAAEAGIAIQRLDGAEFDDRIGLSAAERSFVAGPPETIDRLLGLVGSAVHLESAVRGLYGTR